MTAEMRLPMKIINDAAYKCDYKKIALKIPVI